MGGHTEGGNFRPSDSGVTSIITFLCLGFRACVFRTFLLLVQKPQRGQGHWYARLEQHHTLGIWSGRRGC